MDRHSSTLIPKSVRALVDTARGGWEIGRIGDYSIVDVTGEGGQAVVFKAVDERRKKVLQHLVALKVPLIHSDPDRLVTRLHREIECMEELRSRWVVRLLNSGSVEYKDTHWPYFAMEFIEGRTLREKLRRWGRLPVSECIRIAREIALGIQDMHSKGYVHRDLKPENIMFNSLHANHTVIADLGLAFNNNEHEHNATQDKVAATIRYAPPERLTDGGSADPVSDLYSLGAILYECLTGQPAYTYTDHYRLANAITDPSKYPEAPVRIAPTTPDGLSDLVMHLLEKDPSQRIADIGEIIKQLVDIHDEAGKKPENLSKQWPSVSEEQLCLHLPELAGPTFGIPSEWVSGFAGVLLGLARRVQMSFEIHSATAEVCTKLFWLDHECSAGLDDSEDSLQPEPSDVQRSIDNIRMEFDKVAAPLVRQAASFEKLCSYTGSAKATMESLSRKCRSILGSPDLQATEEKLAAVHEELKISLQALLQVRHSLVERHYYASDRLLTLLVGVGADIQDERQDIDRPS